jgi:hypothetical protein
MRDHLLGLAVHGSDPLTDALRDDVTLREIGRMINMEPEPDPALAAFERDDHLPDGTVKPQPWPPYDDRMVQSYEAQLGPGPAMPTRESLFHGSACACRCADCQASYQASLDKLLGQP